MNFGQSTGFSYPFPMYYYYDIIGSTWKELVNQMNILGPVDSNGNRCHALTEFKLIPTSYLNKIQYASLCVNTANLVDILVTLPSWKHSDGVSTELINRWDHVVRVLGEHEQGHVNIVQENYKLIVLAIELAELTKDYSEVTAAFERIDRFNRDYDKKTDHGRKQDAIFPYGQQLFGNELLYSGVNYY